MERQMFEATQVGGNTVIAGLEIPAPSVRPRRFSVSTANVSGGASTSSFGTAGRRGDTRSRLEPWMGGTGSEAYRTTTRTSKHTSEEYWTPYNNIVEVAISLLEYGAPSHRIEVMVSAIGESFDIPTAFYYLQNYGIIQFPALSSSDDVNGPSSVYLIKCRGSMNFHKLPQVYDLVKQLVRDGSSCDLVRSTLKRIRSDEEKAKEFPEWAIALSYSLSAMTSAIMLFHGTWRDALMSGLLGMIPGALRLVAVQYDVLWWSYEIVACFLISVAATAAAPHFCYSTLILSAPVTILPGYAVTAAVVEMMTKNVIAGSGRLCYTIVYLTFMAFGLTFGSILFHARGDISSAGFARKPSEEKCMEEGAINTSHLWLFLCVPLYIVACNVYLKSPPRQWLPMLVVGSLGYCAGYCCKHIWDAPPEINGFAAALAIGLSANLYTRVYDKFSFNTIVAGIATQVPGSWGLRGILALAYAEYDRGLYFSYQMLAICVGIAWALLLSNYIVWGFKQKNRGVPHMDF